MSTYQNSLLCHENAEALRPREQFDQRGPEGISDLKLLALILGSGTRDMPVEQLAGKVLERLDRHGRQTREEHLEGIPGLGPVKRRQILASLELFRRISIPHHPKIRSPLDLMSILERWADREQEYLIGITLNGANEVIRSTVIGIGIVNRSLVHPREVFAEAIRDRATGIIIAHNHPSGSIEPSSEDNNVTLRIARAGTLMGIPLIDHLIFARNSYYSFMEHGRMPRSDNWQN